MSNVFLSAIALAATVTPWVHVMSLDSAPFNMYNITMDEDNLSGQYERWEKT